MDQLLGIDVGGTGIKGAMVDVATGALLSEKIKYKTPQPALPNAIPEIMKKLIKDFDWEGKPIGCGFPAVIRKGICFTASNIDKAFIQYDLKTNFCKALGCDLYFVNDADAAGLAEVAFGKGKGVMGTLVMLTLGTGIGSGTFLDGKLIPNTEMGHLKYRKSILEKHASNKVRKDKKLNWEEFGQELNLALNYIHEIISPETIIIGGGVSKNFDEYAPYIDVKANVMKAKLLNNAGIIGAACFAHQQIAK